MAAFGGDLGVVLPRAWLLHVVSNFLYWYTRATGFLATQAGWVIGHDERGDPLFHDAFLINVGFMTRQVDSAYKLFCDELTERLQAEVRHAAYQLQQQPWLKGPRHH
jgi:hypothetical protein